MKCTDLTPGEAQFINCVHETILKLHLSFVKVSAKLKEEKEQHKLRGKKKTKQRDSSPQDENREQLFDVPPKKTNGVKEKSKKAAGEESDDLK